MNGGKLKTIEVEGPTVEDAIDRAMNVLSASREEISVRVVSENGNTGCRIGFLVAAHAKDPSFMSDKTPGTREINCPKVLLNIGDQAPDFVLPTVNSEEAALSDYAGERRTIVTTYRAFW